MFSVWVLLAILAGIQAISEKDLVQEQWENFKLEHDKFYESETEEEYRRSVYVENLHKITEHNNLYEQGLTTYHMAMNYMGDLTEEEFLRFYTVEMPELPQIENSSDAEPWLAVLDKLPESMKNLFVLAPSASSEDLANLPGNIDWRSRGVVTRVKNQGQCGSCWSFSATGALEAQWRLHKSGKLIELSEQNLVDCSGKYGNKGCKGGWMHWAFKYIHENGGIDTEQSYPYSARNGQCRYNARNKGATVQSYALIPRGEGQLQAKVGSFGPVSVAAEVSHRFQFYRGGVYNEPQCGHSLNHAMLVVGFNSERGGDYWLVKNSWGAGWGDHGYIKMSRNRNNQCGIALMASFPVV